MTKLEALTEASITSITTKSQWKSSDGNNGLRKWTTQQKLLAISLKNKIHGMLGECNKDVLQCPWQKMQWQIDTTYLLWVQNKIAIQWKTQQMISELRGMHRKFKDNRKTYNLNH